MQATFRRRSLPVMAAAAALGLCASVALAQETGFGGQPDASKNQVPGPGPTKPSDPQAGNPGSAAQVPTAPEVQDDLYNSGVPASADAGDAAPTKPRSSSPN